MDCLEMRGRCGGKTAKILADKDAELARLRGEVERLKRFRQAVMLRTGISNTDEELLEDIERLLLAEAKGNVAVELLGEMWKTILPMRGKQVSAMWMDRIKHRAAEAGITLPREGV
jgi:hypothetical protein